MNVNKFSEYLFFSQAFNLSDKEMGHVVNHLGHTMDVHCLNYSQTSSIIERLDIAKLMILQETNAHGKYTNVHGKFKDMELKDIDLQGIVNNCISVVC